MFKCKFIFFILLSCVFSSLNAAQLANYLGTGSNPNLHLELSPDNGPGWQTFSIGYQSIGNIPSSSSSNNDWSPWNVKDEAGNYYGTITLHSDGSTATWGGYAVGQGGYYLDGIHFTYNSAISAYQLTVDAIHSGAAAGPFPNAPLAQPAVYPGTQDKIILSVSGTHIINNNGKIIQLKGMVRPSLEWSAQGQNLSAQDIQNMSLWGAKGLNAVRIDLNQNYWLSSGPVMQQGSYKQIINAFIYYAIQNNMVVILDLHWTENGHQSPMANQDSLKFWQQVATDYQEFGTVIFELFNEPYGIDKTTWLNGNNDYVGYQQLYNAVRSTGANNICIVNGLDYGYDLSFVNSAFYVNGYNIIYGSHPYDDKGSNSYSGAGGSFSNNFQGVLGRCPLIFTEFGVTKNSYFPTGYETVYQRILSYADQQQISYTGFAWWVDDANPNTFPDLIKDWSGTPLNGGILVQNDMKIYPGTPIDAR